VVSLGTGCKTMMKSWGDLSPATDSRQRYERIIEAQRQGQVASLDESPVTTASSKLEDGDRLRDSGDRAAAVWSYLEALRLDRDSNEPALRIGYLHLRDDPDRSAAIFQALATEETESHRPLLGLGLAHLARSRVGDAITVLEAGHALEPDSSAVLATLAVAYQHAGRNDDALPLLEQANELVPGNARILNNLAVSQLLSGDPNSAEKTLRKGLLVLSDDRIMLNNLGLALGKQYRYIDAKHAFARANDEKAAANNLGWVYYLNGDYPRSLLWYEHALLQPGDGQQTILENIDAANHARDQRSPAAPAEVDSESGQARTIHHPPLN
jgi:Flp pilus assembly protein TadD